MPGLHTIIKQGNPLPDTGPQRTILKHEEYFFFHDLISTASCRSFLSVYDGYPYTSWKHRDSMILLLGLIYNLTEEQIRNSVNPIAEKFDTSGGCNDLLETFVLRADGDFIIQIYNEKSGKLLIFNDHLGRLPFYYYFRGETAVFSSEIKTILETAESIELNKPGIAEFFMFGYQLGNKTIFRDTYRLQPSEAIILTKDKNEIFSTAEFHFSTDRDHISKGASLDLLAETFTGAVRTRHSTLTALGYGTIADLSGGFDTRAVLGALAKCSDHTDYFTFQYIQDESEIAAGLFRLMGSPGTFSKMSFPVVPPAGEITALLYKTDALVNYYTTHVCYHDILYLKSRVPGRKARFSGLGGELIRHPYKICYDTIYEDICNRKYSQLNPSEASSLINYNAGQFCGELKSYLASYPEVTKADQLKRFYYEYYRNHVGIAAEDRERIHFWTVQPFWSLDFMRTVFHQIPLSWSGYGYFIRFLKILEPRLLELPVYKNSTRLNSAVHVRIREAGFHFQEEKRKLYHTMEKKYPGLLHLYKQIRPARTSIDTDGDPEHAFSVFSGYYNQLQSTASIFNPALVEQYILCAGGIRMNYIVSLAMYLTELEKRYGSKVSC
jgi:hypothetical protein